MNTLLKTFFLASTLALSGVALAEEAAAPDVAAEAPAADAAAKPTVEMTASGDHVVKVNTGNETTDAVANYAAKCAEKIAAMKTCDALGGFKAMGCRQLAKIRYKGAECPEL